MNSKILYSNRDHYTFEKQLRWWEGYLHQVIQSLPDPVVVTDLQGNTLAVNDKLLQTTRLSREQVIGQPFAYSWLPPEDGKRSPHWFGKALAQLYRTSYLPEFEVTCLTGQGETKTLGITCSLLRDEEGQPQLVLTVARDLTQRNRLEPDLWQVQKMQAIGQLAADINNDLTIILGFCEFLMLKSETLTLDEEVCQAIDSIQKQSLKYADTVRRIQVFATPTPQSHFARFSVNEVVRDVIQLTEPRWRDQAQRAGIAIEVSTDLGELPPVHGHASGLKEALENLLSNAVEALPSGGVISFKTFPSDDEVVLEIKDTGIGISPVHLNRVFDPFFTTKGPAHVGLGLSIAYNQIANQGGRISVNSTDGLGTTFTISLPACQEPAAIPEIEPEEQVKRSLSVLVVDDEPIAVEVLQAMLESSGHWVTTCLSAREALKAFQEDIFDLVLVDLGMPEMDGWELSRRMNQIHPAIPIVLATGWNVSAADCWERGAKIRAVLKKPFGMEQLSYAITAALQAE